MLHQQRGGLNWETQFRWSRTVNENQPPGDEQYNEKADQKNRTTEIHHRLHAFRHPGQVLPRWSTLVGTPRNDGA